MFGSGGGEALGESGGLRAGAGVAGCPVPAAEDAPEGADDIAPRALGGRRRMAGEGM